MMSPITFLWLGLNWLGIGMIQANYVVPYYQFHGHLLKYFVFIFGVFLLASIFDHRPSPNQGRNRFWLLSISSLILLVVIGWNQIHLRTDPWHPFGIHDGAVHTEIAADFLLQGKDPYGSDYSHTPYRLTDPPIPSGPAENIVWHHFIYPPGVFLIQVPITFIAHRFGTWGDFRILTIGSLILLWWLLVQRTSSWTQRSWHTLATIANPLVWIFVLPGHNDILSVTALVASFIMIEKKKWWWAGILFGLALTLKQSIWISLPLVVFYGWRQWKEKKLTTSQVRNFFVSACITVVVMFLPFFLWSPYHFYDDLVRYASGSIPFAYAISGSTVLQYLVAAKWVASPWSIIPTWFFQLLVGIPGLVLTGWWLRKRTTLDQLLTSIAVLTLILLMFSRYFNANYFSAIWLLFYASYALRHPPSENSN